MTKSTIKIGLYVNIDLLDLENFCYFLTFLTVNFIVLKYKNVGYEFFICKLIFTNLRKEY